MEPWNGECRHSFLIELKYCKHESTDADVMLKRQEAIDQLAQYSAAHSLQQKATGNGWTLHQFAIVFRGWHCELIEEQ